MKYLLLLIPIIALANYKAEITNSETNKEYRAIFETEEELNKWIASNESNESWGHKDKWAPLSSVKDESKCQEIRDVVNELEQVVDQECFLAQNYDIKIKDISDEVRAERLKEQEDKQEIQDIKAMIQTVRDSNKPNWEKKLLIRLIRELK